jgi:hypothetical protein
MIRELKNKPCVMCKVDFKRYRLREVACSPKCAIDYAKLQRSKAIAKNNKVELNKLKTKGELLKELQIIFNRYIRLRDKNQPCISCDRPLTSKYDAGHCFSVGSYPNIRFNEDNVHGQCVFCNQHKHGQQAEYLFNLPKRIGQERFDQLLDLRNTPLKLSLIEIEELKTIYKAKIKSLQNK